MTDSESRTDPREELRALLAPFFPHYECEDCWYSCPKSTEGSCNDALGDECNCGAEARIDACADALLASEQFTIGLRAQAHTMYCPTHDAEFKFGEPGHETCGGPVDLTYERATGGWSD